MQQGETAILKAKTISGKNKLYGVAGEKVKVIFISLPAVIVENKTGLRFPTTIDNLTLPVTPNVDLQLNI